LTFSKGSARKLEQFLRKPISLLSGSEKIHFGQPYVFSQGYNPGVSQGYNPGLSQGYNPGVSQGYYSGSSAEGPCLGSGCSGAQPAQGKQY